MRYVHGGQIDHGNGTSDRGANHRVGDDFSTGGVDLEVRAGGERGHPRC